MESHAQAFAAPTPRLQTDVLSDNKKEARTFLEVLYRNKEALPERVVRDAALLSFAAEDYHHASALIEEGLQRGGNRSSLLMARGLVQYETGYYPRALESFSQVELPQRETEGAVLLTAALKTNRAEALWQSGQTGVIGE